MRGELISVDCALFCCKALRKVARALKKWGETPNYISSFSLHFFCALAASGVLYNRTEHSQGLFIC